MKILAGALLLALSAGAAADEGLWTFDHFPKAMVKEQLGVDITDAWLDHLRLATTRLESGCTGSFVSADGLVLTNHHCSWACIAQNSTPESSLFDKGFLAKTREQELPCRTQQVSVLVASEEVTDQVAKAIAGLDDKAANEARKRELTRLEQACEEASKKKGSKTGPLSCATVTLYEGGQYFLYRYKRYSDVRLVFTPEQDIGAFGGDPDNFQFPRWCLDMSVLRVYEKGKAARTPNHLHINFDGPATGEAVFVSGHPGTTDRLQTVAQLKATRDAYLPLYLLRNAELRGRYLMFAKQSPESERITYDAINGIENSLKVRRKQLDALLDDRLMANKAADEEELRRAVAADPALRELAGNAWEEMAKAQDAYRNLVVPHTFIEGAAGFNSQLYRHARNLVRGAAERAKPNEERLREYTEAALPRLTQALGADTPVYPDLEEMTLTFGFERMREWLGPDASIVHAVLGTQSPDALAAALVTGTKLADPRVRMELWNGGVAAVEASADPMIVLARKVDPEARALRKRFEDEVEAPTQLAGERLARVRFKVRGTSVYPDATFTLRLNPGTVQGWVEAGTPVPPFTHLNRLFERATGVSPFRVPDSWLAAKPQLDLSTPFNLSTDSDTHGGNSGSPLVNARGELVGLMFDGNIHSIAGSYWFDTEKNRSVAVHPAIIREALTKVYHADALYKEMQGAR
jgi:hypothetical protein